MSGRWKLVFLPNHILRYGAGEVGLAWIGIIFFQSDSVGRCMTRVRTRIYFLQPAA